MNTQKFKNNFCLASISFFVVFSSSVERRVADVPTDASVAEKPGEKIVSLEQQVTEGRDNKLKKSW